LNRPTTPQTPQASLARTIWRVGLIATMMGGLTWFITLPTWILTSSQQIVIKGNQLLGDDIIRSLLPIRYPQPLLWIDPQTIALHLKAKTPFAWVVVKRTLIPPGLIIEVKERHPVAVALSTPMDNLSHIKNIDLLDEAGIVVPLQHYRLVNPSFQPPTLQVIGLPYYYQGSWTSFYHTVHQSEILIKVIDWRDPSNIKLVTELGTIHLGVYNAQRLIVQLESLAKLKRVPDVISSNKYQFIDLRNPIQPRIQLIK